MKTDDFRSLIEAELIAFDQALNNKRPLNLYTPIKYTLELGGKRFRPMLTLMGCLLFNGKPEEAIKAAVGIELFHNFTLVHDDIMDKAPLRRNKPTVQKQWNQDIAILSGDALFVQSVQYIMQSPSDKLKEVLEIFTQTALEVCEGQQLDMDFEKQYNVTIPQYIKMIGLKTSVLLAGSLKIGAVIGGAGNNDAHHLYEFGKNLGIAFQLHDDILDVFGASDKVGKQKGGDIVSNKKTYLFLKAIEVADRYSKEKLQMWMQAGEESAAEKVESVKTIYEFLNVKVIAEAEMRKYFEKALEHLNSIEHCNNEVKVQIREFAENLMQRES